MFIKMYPNCRIVGLLHINGRLVAFELQEFVLTVTVGY